MRLTGLDPSPARACRRLRGGPDLSPAGIAVAAFVVALFAFDAARAAPAPAAIDAIRVGEDDNLDVTLTVQGDRAPTFQVYQASVGSDGAVWVVELPGATLPRAGVVAAGAGVVLRDAHVEGGDRIGT
jgi:hypothetical protein